MVIAIEIREGSIIDCVKNRVKVVTFQKMVVLILKKNKSIYEIHVLLLSKTLFLFIRGNCTDFLKLKIMLNPTIELHISLLLIQIVIFSR